MDRRAWAGSGASRVRLLRQGLTSRPFAPPHPHLTQFIQTPLLSLATAFIYKPFQCFVFGNSFSIEKGKSTVLEKLWEPCSVRMISRLKYLCQVWSFFSLSKCIPCKGIKVETEEQIESKGVGKGYSFMGRSCGFSLQMCWSIDWCTQGKTQLLQKCSSGTAQPAEPPLLVSALSSQLQNYWFKHFTIDCTIKAWVEEGTCS